MSRYKTPEALRRALEDRLFALVRREGGDINRLRRQTAFDRLLCRLLRETNAPWLLKGGYAMELRIQAARTTRDIDLASRRLPGGAKEWDEAAIRNLLEAAAGFDLGDSFEFTIGEPTMDLDAAPYGRSRYPVEAQMTVNSSNATFSVLDRRTGRPWNQRVGSLRLLPPARDESNDD